jgi:hypothetical protein
MYLRIRSSKADQRGKNTLIISEQKGSESDICPVKRLKQFVVILISLSVTPLLSNSDAPPILKE